MELSEILDEFPKKRIVVIGDVMLDKAIYGDASRISPEAPVQIIKVEKEVYGPGGAANVAANIKSLKGEPILFGFTGKDEASKTLSKVLEERKIRYFFDETLRTTVKARIMPRNHQIARLDYEETSEKRFSDRILKKLEEEINNSDLILLSDYAKGTITEDLISFLKTKKKKIIVDPKPQNTSLYYNSFLITPNENEALQMSMKNNFQSAGIYLKEKLNCHVLITLGEKGMALFQNNSLDREIHIPTYAKDMKDISGAGDTVIATLSLSLASKASLEEAAIIANHAAGIAVGRAGVYQVQLNELKRMFFGEEEKLKTFDELYQIVMDLKESKRTIVWTNGAFDVPHAGHLKCLKEAKDEGDYLIVGLNSDSSIRKIKGPHRPTNPEDKRVEFISSLPWVDYIVIYSEPDTTRYLSAFKPDIYAKGGDYNIDTINQDERKIVESYGGKIAFVGGSKIDSTTDIIKRIVEKNKKSLK
ncbi:hypothetical protein DRN69_01850 [Candidatus Pacearchaeota archaeon]|nr:MAG: hypothetical protein DRN69_01850 [Candidatus Pacearchaeota archaeon]